MKKILLAGLLCKITGIIAVEEDLIRSISVTSTKVKVSIHEQFKKRYLKDDFFAEYEGIDLTTLDYSIQIMPFIMNVISIVWISGKTYYVDALDAELYESLKTVKKVIQKLYSKTRWKGELIPRKLVHNTFIPVEDDKERVALLFSGGVDSTASSFYHRTKKQLLVTVWGHWDLPLGNEHLWAIRKRCLDSFAAEYGYESAFLKSNYFSFLNRAVLDNLSPEITSWRILAVEGIGWAGLVAPLLILKGYPVLLHGSTISWDFPYPAAANPFIDDNIRFSGVGLKHDLFDLNRLEKCKLIGAFVKEHRVDPPFLRVCEEKIVRNCCRCQKCLRTILELLVVGEDPRDYGFFVGLERTMKGARALLSSSLLSATTVWHFKHIQDFLKAKKNRGKQIDPLVEWILDVELTQKKTAEVRNAASIRWTDFIEFLPTISVPSRYTKELPMKGEAV